MAVPKNPNIFNPPSAAQLSQHLSSNMPVQMGMWYGRGPLIGLVVGMGMMLILMQSPGAALLPLFGLLGLLAYMSGRSRAENELQMRVMRAWELAMIRRYRDALGQAWELVPACRTKPELHGRVVTVIAHILSELGKEEAADVAYSYLLDRLPADHPLALRLKVHRAVSALLSGRLADGDDALRKLRGQVESASDASLAASYHMARLVQDVQTGHYADAADKADDTAQALAPLSAEAGYGHALLALCFHHLAQRAASAEEPDEAERQRLADSALSWWHRATLLIPASALVYRHPELRTLPAQIDELASTNNAPSQNTDTPTTPPSPTTPPTT